MQVCIGRYRTAELHGSGTGLYGSSTELYGSSTELYGKEAEKKKQKQGYTT